jgi:uncharacterized protein (TIGR02391 family)
MRERAGHVRGHSYHRGKYDTTVFEAMKAVEVAARAAAGFTAADIDTKLMRKAFDVDNGPLTDKATEQAERQARSDLFAGAIGSYKNPHSHRNVALAGGNASPGKRSGDLLGFLNWFFAGLCLCGWRSASRRDSASARSFRFCQPQHKTAQGHAR